MNQSSTYASSLKTVNQGEARTACRASRLEGFISTNNLDLWQDFQRDVEQWISEGKIKWQETIVHGLENTPAAFLDLFAGKNTGKMLVKLSSH